MVPITSTFASLHIIVVPTPPLCTSPLISGSQTAGPGTPRLNHALVCLRPQTTGLPLFMTRLERPTCIVSHLLPLSDQTAKPSTTVRMVTTTRWSQICCSRRTTRTSCACGASRTSHLTSRMHSTTILSRHIGYQLTTWPIEDPRRALMVKTPMLRTEVTPRRALGAPLQFLTTVHSLSTLIRLEPSPPRTTPSGTSLAEADALSYE